MRTLFIHINGLVQATKTPIPKVAGAAMKMLPVLNNAWLLAEDNCILNFGSMDEAEDIPVGVDRVIDVTGKFIFPSYCDSHTHLVFASKRDSEFVDRINGLTYQDIAAKGGGILNSVAKLRAMSEQELYDSAWQRLDEIMATGTGAVEIKSGYGLSVEAELKMLRVIHRLSQNHPLTIKATLLAAHAVPLEFAADHEGYLKCIISEIIPAVAAENLAEYLDVFCEKNYFSVSDTNRILEAGVKYGLTPKVHVNQFNVIGGVTACVEHGALSVDHLELISDEDIAVLKNSSTMPVALPGCSFFIKIPYSPARTIMDSGLPLALASDYNPGSAPSGNMNFINSLACIHMNMTPEEAIHASTLNGAYAMGVEEQCGTISPGKKANLFVTQRMHSIAEIPYSFGSNLIESVWIEGVKR